MAIREEIREELAVVLAHIDGRQWNELTVIEASDYIKKTESVVIRAERELPKNPHLEEALSGFGKAAETYGKAQQKMLKAGYVAVEPLIDKKE